MASHPFPSIVYGHGGRIQKRAKEREKEPANYGEKRGHLLISIDCIQLQGQDSEKS